MAQRRTVEDLTVQHIHTLISGHRWFFIADPSVFKDDTEALAVYKTIRHVLLPWCREHLKVAELWAELLITKRPVWPVTTETHGFTLQSCRDFLAVLSA